MRTFSTPYKKISSKWIKDLNLGTGTLKLLGGNTGGTHFDTKMQRYLFGSDSYSNGNKNRNEQMRAN